MKKLIMALAATTVLAGPAVADEVRTQSFMWGDTWTVAYDAGNCGTNAMDGNGNHVCSLGWLLKNGGWSKDGADAAISNKDARAAYNEYLAAQDDAEEAMEEMMMEMPEAPIIDKPVIDLPEIQPLPMPAPVAPAPVAPAPTASTCTSSRSSYACSCPDSGTSTCSSYACSDSGTGSELHASTDSGTGSSPCSERLRLRLLLLHR